MKFTYFKLLFAFIISTSIYNICYAQSSNANALIGNWESVNTVNNRVQLLKYESDSTFYTQSALPAEYSYNIIGNKMIATLLRSNKIIIDTTDIIIKKDTLISILRRNDSAEITTMIRIPGENSDSNGIVGNYKWKYPNAHTAFSKFTKDGIWIFRLPVETEKGNYKVSHDTITVSYAGLPPEKLKYWVNDKVLILTDVKTGKEDLYKKVDYFIKD